MITTDWPRAASGPAVMAISVSGRLRFRVMTRWLKTGRDVNRPDAGPAGVSVGADRTRCAGRGGRFLRPIPAGM